MWTSSISTINPYFHVHFCKQNAYAIFLTSVGLEQLFIINSILDIYFSVYKDKGYYWTGFIIVIYIRVYTYIHYFYQIIDKDMSCITNHDQESLGQIDELLLLLHSRSFKTNTSDGFRGVEPNITAQYCNNTKGFITALLENIMSLMYMSVLLKCINLFSCLWFHSSWLSFRKGSNRPEWPILDPVLKCCYDGKNDETNEIFASFAKVWGKLSHKTVKKKYFKPTVKISKVQYSYKSRQPNLYCKTNWEVSYQIRNLLVGFLVSLGTSYLSKISIATMHAMF